VSIFDLRRSRTSQLLCPGKLRKTLWSGPHTSSNELDRDLARHPHALLKVHEVNGCFERSNGSCSVLDDDFIRRLGAEKQFLRSIQARAARRVA